MHNTVIETVQAEKFTMDYFRFGHGKETLAILPGISVLNVMGFAAMVEEAYKVLADDFTIYLFDRRKEMPEGYTVHDMADDTAEVFRILGFEQINVFGASQGGMIAMDIAIRYPELIRKLVLGSTSPKVEDERLDMFDKWVRLAEEKKGEELFLAFGEAVYPQELFDQSKDMMIKAARAITDEDFERFSIMTKGIKGFDVEDELGTINCPVLLIGSEDDNVLGADASREIIKRLEEHKDFEWYMYDGYGHAAYDTAPDYKERMLHFLV